MSLKMHAVQNAATKTSVDQLASISNRLASITTQQLPCFAPQISEQIWSSRKTILAAIESPKGEEDAAIVNRLRTQLSTLLQGRTVEGRWAAVILVKAAIESGGILLVETSMAWVKYLLQILKKGADPSTTRSFAAINLLRMFTLTWHKPNLIREFTTPNLPSFISVCLANSQSPRCSSVELWTYLEVFATLLPKHPTIFRTDEDNIRRLCLNILQSTSEALPDTVPRKFTQRHQSSARAILALLHHCAQKQGASDKWAIHFNQTVKVAHQTCDILFRSLHEDWISTTGRRSSIPRQELLSGYCGTDAPDEIDLCPWRGVHDGGERLAQLLRLLSTFLDVGTTSVITIKIGMIIDLVSRILSMTKNCRAQHEIPKQERTDLLQVLPTVHLVAVDLIDKTLERLGDNFINLAQSVFDLIRVTSESYQENDVLRSSVFRLLEKLVTMYGPGFEHEDVKNLNEIIKACCYCLLPPENSKSQALTAQPTKIVTMQDMGKVDRKQYSNTLDPWTSQTHKDCAQKLLSAVILKLNPKDVSSSTRALLDRTAILSIDKQAMIASVMNPPLKPDGTHQTSTLPILARMFPHDLNVESILRPRMPAITQHQTHVEDGESESDTSAVEVDKSFSALPYQEDEDAEPTSGLLSALAEDADRSTREIYDMADKTTQNNPVESTLQKHDFTDFNDIGAGSSAKRMRLSPATEVLLPGHENGTKGPNSIAADAIPPVVAELSSLDRERTKDVSNLRGSLQTDDGKADVVQGKGDLEAEESDFEMPHLTMEPDTDPED